MKKDIEEHTFEEKFVAALMPQINTDIYNALIKHCIKAKLISSAMAEENRQKKTDLDDLIHINLKVIDLLLNVEKERFTPSTFKDYQLEKRFKVESVAKEIAKKMKGEALNI